MATIAGLFRNWDNAAQAIDLLSTSGFDANDISLVATEDVAKQHREDQGGIAAPLLGGQAMAFTGSTSAAAGGIGPLYIVGPFNPGHGRSDRQAAAGQEVTPDEDDHDADLLSALTQVGITTEHANAYIEGLRRGEVLVAVNTDDNAAQARNLLNQANAAHVSGS